LSRKKQYAALLGGCFSGALIVGWILTSTHVLSYVEEDQVSFFIKLGTLCLIVGFGVASIWFCGLNRTIFSPYVALLSKYRHLLWQLIKKDFKAKYRRSVLGVVWTLLNPMLIMLVLTAVFSTLFRFDIENYPVYLLSGQVLFGFFNEATTLSLSSVIAGSGLIRKVYVPKFIFPLSRVLSSGVNLLFSLIALFIVMLITRAPLHWTLALLPLPLVYILLFSLGVGLALSSIAVFFRDATYLYGVFITMLMYLTPVFYPASILPERFRIILTLNPMAHFVAMFRNIVLYGVPPTLWENAVCSCFCVVSLLIGAFIFIRQQDNFFLHL